MRRRKNGYKKIKLKASSLIELIIAMVIITIIMMLGFTIFLNLKFSSINSTKIKAYELAEKQCAFIREKGVYLNNEQRKNEFVINTKCENYNTELMAVTIQIKAPGGYVFAEIKELINIK